VAAAAPLSEELGALEVGLGINVDSLAAAGS